MAQDRCSSQDWSIDADCSFLLVKEMALGFLCIDQNEMCMTEKMLSICRPIAKECSSGFAVVKLNHLLIVLCIVKIYDLHSSTLLATLENPPRVSLSNSPEFLVAQCAGWCRLYSASEAPVLRWKRSAERAQVDPIRMINKLQSMMVRLDQPLFLYVGTHQSDSLRIHILQTVTADMSIMSQ